MKRFFLSLLLISLFIPALRAKEAEHPYLPRLVKIYSDDDLDSLKNEGVEVLRRRGDILLCLYPNTQTRGAASSCLRHRTITPTLDVAKTYYDAQSIQNGHATGTPYTGKGIVVGICDVGIDPLHPTFLDSNGKSRIKRVVQYVEHEGIRLQLDGDDDYRLWQTDDADEYHATHVCGILAGNGAGTPYSGIATDAEIVVTVSTLTDVGLLAGVEDIIDYAKEVGKPAVINLSVGSYTGPHDGTSLFSQYLDMCAEDAFIVLSSGNEGQRTNTLITDFTDSRPEVAFRLGNKGWDQFKMYGATDIWSGSAQPLSVALGVYDSHEKKVINWFDSFTLTDGDYRCYEWDESDHAQKGFPFIGNLEIEGGVDSENGRHRTILGYDFTSPEKSEKGNWARYDLALKVTGLPGNDLEVYSDGSYTRLVGLSGNPVPSSVRSVSDLACGHNVICVGMYGNRDSIPYSSPAEFEDDKIYYKKSIFEGGATSEYSSYGTLRDGRILPHTIAPGGSLMSAASRPFLSLYPDCTHLKMGGSQWIDEGGTSMSSPYVAGYIATWLEAVPSLTIDDVKRIIAQSNRTDIKDADDPHNIPGYFDPVQALKLALGASGVEDIEKPDGPLSAQDYIELYDLAGVKRYSGTVSDINGIEKGLYIVKSPYGIRKQIFP